MISKLHYISQGNTAEEHLNNIQSACTAGADWVQLEVNNLNKKKILKVAEKAREVTSHFQTRLIITDDYKLAKEVNADGVCLVETNVNPQKIKDYLGKFYTVGGTANTLEDCKRLIAKKVDYITLGSFRAKEVHKKQHPVLGVIGYQTIIDELNTNTPILATGGIELEDVEEIIKTGVFGVAVSDSITKNFNNISRFNNVLNAPSTNEMVYKL